ncbi:MAG TPA: CHASE sensor domain-containing protein, partial [Methylotenera sp.]|nr:CHASE sensor domain-containing protein [Methylotenera sp.]
MKHLFGFRSIRHKLLIGVLLTTFLALFISGTIIIIYDAQQYEARTLEDLSTQADLIGQASIAALQFNDRDVAMQTLSLLRLRPQVITAAIYTANGDVFASYRNPEYPDVTLPDFPATESFNLKADQISLPRPIRFENELLGHIYLLADYPYYQRMSRNIGIILGVTILALAISMLMSLWIQSRITRPIMNVTRLAHRVVEKQDYQSRAEKISDDEIGYLVD